MPENRQIAYFQPYHLSCFQYRWCFQPILESQKCIKLSMFTLSKCYFQQRQPQKSGQLQKEVKCFRSWLVFQEIVWFDWWCREQNYSHPLSSNFISKKKGKALLWTNQDPFQVSPLTVQQHWNNIAVEMPRKEGYWSLRTQKNAQYYLQISCEVYWPGKKCDMWAFSAFLQENRHQIWMIVNGILVIFQEAILNLNYRFQIFKSFC